MDVRRDLERPAQRALSPNRDRDVITVGERQDAESVGRRLLERLIPERGRDAEQLDFRAPESEEKRDRIVMTRVAVENDGNARQLVPLCSQRAKVVDGRGKERVVQIEETSPE